MKIVKCIDCGKEIYLEQDDVSNFLLCYDCRKMIKVVDKFENIYIGRCEDGRYCYIKFFKT